MSTLVLVVALAWLITKLFAAARAFVVAYREKRQP
jgi:hypothetical protein